MDTTKTISKVAMLYQSDTLFLKGLRLFDVSGSIMVDEQWGEENESS